MTINQEKYLDGFYKFSLVFVKLAYLNLLWIGITLAGLVVFGLFPATIATFSIARRMIKEEKSFPIAKEFLGIVKNELLKGNLMGYLHLLIGFIIYVDVLYFEEPTSLLALVMFYFFRIVLIVYVIFSIYLFIVYVHYETKIWGYYKNILSIIILKPLTAVALVLTVFCLFLLFRILPGLIPFYLPSGIAYALTLISYSSFLKIQAINTK